MSDRVLALWSDDVLAYDFGSHHPLQPVRWQLTIDLVRACGLLDLPTVTVGVPTMASRAVLEGVHDPAYVEAVARIDETMVEQWGDYGHGLGTGDNPVFRGMFTAASLVCGGAVAAADAVWSGAADHAWYPFGGHQHHAMPANAHGFGIFNDTAVAIQQLLDAGASRVAYVDIDVHHGDGVQAIFFNDPRVLTISLHESGAFLFPGTGWNDEIGAGEAAGTKANIPLPPFTTDDPYLAVFERVVPDLLAAFKPDAIVTQLGCDTHAADPLAHLALTTRAYRTLYAHLHTLAHTHCDGRWIATGGGGYGVFDAVPRAWTMAFAEMTGAQLPDELPAAYLEDVHARAGHAVSATFTEAQVSIDPAKIDQVNDEAMASAEQTRATILSFYR